MLERTFCKSRIDALHVLFTIQAVFLAEMCWYGCRVLACCECRFVLAVSIRATSNVDTKFPDARGLQVGRNPFQEAHLATTFVKIDSRTRFDDAVVW